MVLDDSPIYRMSSSLDSIPVQHRTTATGSNLGRAQTPALLVMTREKSLFKSLVTGMRCAYEHRGSRRSQTADDRGDYPKFVVNSVFTHPTYVVPPFDVSHPSGRLLRSDEQRNRVRTLGETCGKGLVLDIEPHVPLPSCIRYELDNQFDRLSRHPSQRTLLRSYRSEVVKSFEHIFGNTTITGIASAWQGDLPYKDILTRIETFYNLRR